jgi:hypothetical protein
VAHALVARRAAESSPFHRNVSATRSIAGCWRFFTLIQCFDRPVYFSSGLNGGSLPGGTVSSATAKIIAVRM